MFHRKPAMSGWNTIRNSRLVQFLNASQDKWNMNDEKLCDGIMNGLMSWLKCFILMMHVSHSYWYFLHWLSFTRIHLNVSDRIFVCNHVKWGRQGFCLVSFMSFECLGVQKLSLKKIESMIHFFKFFLYTMSQWWYFEKFPLNILKIQIRKKFAGKPKKYLFFV